MDGEKARGFVPRLSNLCLTAGVVALAIEVWAGAVEWMNPTKLSPAMQSQFEAIASLGAKRFLKSRPQ